MIWTMIWMFGIYLVVASIMFIATLRIMYNIAGRASWRLELKIALLWPVLLVYSIALAIREIAGNIKGLFVTLYTDIKNKKEII